MVLNEEKQKRKKELCKEFGVAEDFNSFLSVANSFLVYSKQKGNDFGIERAEVFSEYRELKSLFLEEKNSTSFGLSFVLFFLFSSSIVFKEQLDKMDSFLDEHLYEVKKGDITINEFVKEVKKNILVFLRKEEEKETKYINIVPGNHCTQNVRIVSEEELKGLNDIICFLLEHDEIKDSNVFLSLQKFIAVKFFFLEREEISKQAKLKLICFLVRIIVAVDPFHQGYKKNCFSLLNNLNIVINNLVCLIEKEQKIIQVGWWEGEEGTKIYEDFKKFYTDCLDLLFASKQEIKVFKEFLKMRGNLGENEKTLEEVTYSELCLRRVEFFVKKPLNYTKTLIIFSLVFCFVSFLTFLSFRCQKSYLKKRLLLFKQQKKQLKVSFFERVVRFWNGFIKICLVLFFGIFFVLFFLVILFFIIIFFRTL